SLVRRPALLSCRYLPIPACASGAWHQPGCWRSSCGSPGDRPQPRPLAIESARELRLVHVTLRPGVGSWPVDRQDPSKMTGQRVMPYTGDSNTESTVGREASPVAAALARLPPSEAPNS